MRKVLLTIVLGAGLAMCQESGHETQHARAAVEQGEAGQEHEMPNEIWWKWANFAILAVALGWLIGKNAGPYFRSRTAAIQEGIAESQKIKAEADARAAAIEARLANLNTEIESLRKSAHEEIALEGARVRTETEQQIRKVQAHAEQEIAAAAKTASQQLKAQAAELALQLAEQRLRSQVTPDTQATFVSAFVHDLERQPGRDGKASRN